MMKGRRTWRCDDALEVWNLGYGIKDRSTLVGVIILITHDSTYMYYGPHAE